MATTKVDAEVIDFIVGGMTPEDIIAFRPSAEVQARFEELLDSSRSSTLTIAESSELDHYMQIEHIMRVAKAQAHKKLLPK